VAKSAAITSQTVTLTSTGDAWLLASNAARTPYSLFLHANLKYQIASNRQNAPLASPVLFEPEPLQNVVLFLLYTITDVGLTV